MEEPSTVSDLDTRCCRHEIRNGIRFECAVRLWVRSKDSRSRTWWLRSMANMHVVRKIASATGSTVSAVSCPKDTQKLRFLSCTKSTSMLNLFLNMSMHRRGCHYAWNGICTQLVLWMGSSA